MLKKLLLAIPALALSAGLVLASPVFADTTPTDSYGYNAGPYGYSQTYEVNTPWNESYNKVNYPLYYFPTWNYAGTGVGYGGYGYGLGGYGLGGYGYGRIGCRY